jgi:outer membrane biosynthesis protein TonB
VSFVVEKDGSLSGTKIARGVTPEINAEAIRLVKNSAKWIPGTVDGKPVRVAYTVPVVFDAEN